ncbi:MAG: hypothetical protein IJ733_04885 [Lachnospiraceae bacterium]|nr:hypothetical protein [Lachnospiraceae bacterium]
MTRTLLRKGLAITAAGLLAIISILPISCKVKAAPDKDSETGSEATSEDADTGNTITDDTDTEGDASSEAATQEDVSSENETEAGTDTAFDPDGTYHAALGLQTATKLWIYRFGYYAENPGGSYCPYGEENWSKLTRNYNDEVDTEETEDKVVVPGDFTDVELKGNGTYTVKLENADFQKETTLSQLQIATDLPLDAEIQISDIQVTINGIDIVHFDEAVFEEEEPYLTGGKVVLLFNHWRDGLKAKLAELGCTENAPNGWELLDGREEESISVTFTVSGFNYDNEEAVEPEATEDVSDLGKIIGADSSDNPAKENESGGISVVAAVGGVFVLIAVVITGIVIRKRK